MHNLSTAELRKMLREQRKKTSAPSKMKKHELIAELEKYGVRERSSSPEKSHSSPTPALPVKEKKEHSKKETNSKKETSPSAPPPMKEEKSVKKEKKSTTSSAVAPASEGVKKMVKGSQEARDKMAKLRAMRSSKKNVD